MLPDLKVHAQELGIANKVQYSGFKCGAALAEEYSSAALSTVPTIVEEAFGIVAAEALGCGTKLLVNNRGALPEVVGKWGELVEPTVEGWAKALMSARPFNQMQRMDAHNGTRDRFGWKKIAKSYEELLLSITR
jgi:glycosyltransferase involved in cell wall biosynthesis